MNLVVDARDAMPTGGKLTIETTNVVLAADTNGHAGPHAMIAVTDTGTGMDASTMTQVFEPFFTTKPHGKGTGLGLSTVFGIVHQANGRVSVRSTLGGGTTFEIYLPISAAEPSVPITPEARPGTRLIFMSGYTGDGVVRHGVLDASLAYVQKPFTPQTLTRKIREVLDA